ncbi:MAG: hypothetical protein AAGA44_12135 [Pseudomonadota bacterium]
MSQSDDDSVNNSSGLQILPGGTARLSAGSSSSKAQDKARVSSNVQNLMDSAPVFVVNDNDGLRVTEGGESQRLRNLQVNFTPSIQEQSIRNMEKERDFKQRRLDGLRDKEGNFREQHLGTAKALQKSIDHINDEIRLTIEVFPDAQVASQSPPIAPSGGSAEALSVRTGNNPSLSLADIANDPELPEHLREKAAAQLKRMRPRN